MRIVMTQPLMAETIARPWLTTRKQPGKFCRPGSFAIADERPVNTANENLSNDLNRLNRSSRLARRSHG
jgi:hypothetical protein